VFVLSGLLALEWTLLPHQRWADSAMLLFLEHQLLADGADAQQHWPEDDCGCLHSCCYDPHGRWPTSPPHRRCCLYGCDVLFDVEHLDIKHFFIVDDLYNSEAANTGRHDIGSHWHHDDKYKHNDDHDHQLNVFHHVHGYNDRGPCQS